MLLNEEMKGTDLPSQNYVDLTKLLKEEIKSVEHLTKDKSRQLVFLSNAENDNKRKGEPSEFKGQFIP